MPRLFVLFMTLALLAGFPAAVAAQDATPASDAMASPTAGPCDAPALPPGTPTPREPEGSPMASPAADMAGMEMGTPEAVEEAEEVAEIAEEATPEMAPSPVGTPANQATADEAIAAAENFANCLNSGNAEALAALASPNLIMFFFGTANPYDVVAAMEEDPLPPITVRSFDNPQTYDDGKVSVDAVYTGAFAFGPSQVNRDRWFFVEEGGYWLLDAIESLQFEGDAAVVIEAELIEYAFVLSQNTAPAGGVIAFNLVNSGEYPHELALIRLPEGMTLQQVLEDPSLEEQIEFFGGNFAGPGGRASVAFENLEPGTYTLICFIDEPEGVPHVVRGMVAEFTVQ